MIDELLNGHTDVPGDLAQQKWRYVPSLVIGNCCLAAIAVFELAV